jgi:hypothetical protein
LLKVQAGIQRTPVMQENDYKQLIHKVID